MVRAAMPTKFCHECGNPLQEILYATDSRTRLTCGHCGAIHYENPKVLVWSLAHCGLKMLLCKRAIEPAQGLWNPPAGFVELGESLEEAMARELKEETGIELAPAQFMLYRVASVPHMNQVYVGFRAEFDVEPELLRTHLTDLLGQLVENGLLQVLPADVGKTEAV